MERTKKRLWMYLIKLFCSALKSFAKLTTTRVCAVLCSFVCAEAVTSVTRLGDFWKLLAPNLITKVAQKDRWLFGLFCKRSLYVKLLWLQFGQLLEAFGLLCVSNIWSHWKQPPIEANFGQSRVIRCCCYSGPCPWVGSSSSQNEGKRSMLSQTGATA